MSKEIDQIVDIRFNIKHDNPFRLPRDLTRTQDLTNNFYNLITQNPNNFKSVNWVEDARIKRINKFDDKRVFGLPVDTKLSNNKKLSFLVADYLHKVDGVLEKGLIPELKGWVEKNNTSFSGGSFSTQPTNQTNQTNQINQNDKPNEQSESISPQNEPINLMNNLVSIPEFETDTNAELIYKTTDDITTYDLTPGKQITYEDLCKLTCSIARSQLTDIVKKDENILFIEEREKDILRKNLEKYLGNADIATTFPNIDVNSLTLKQLQYYSIHIEDYYETLKLMNFMKKGLDLADLGYTKIFPDGIPMPGGKYKVRLDGTVESVKKVLFDRESPVKIAFKNIQEKYNLHISDEFLVCLNIGAAICSKVHIDKVEPKEDKEPEISESETESD